MTLYTPKQRFPYPASKAEYGNAAAQLEALAVVADAGLDRITANWSALQRPGVVIYQLAADFNLSIGGGLTDFTPPSPTFNTVFASSNINTTGSPFGGATSGGRPNSQRGWWDISIHVATQPTGTANANTRRYLQVQKLNLGNQVSSDTNIYISEDFETSVGGITSHELNFMINIDSITSGLFLSYFHGNTSSSVNILAAGTFLECVQVSGAIT